jgi:mannose-6-phosphate isomerase
VHPDDEYALRVEGEYGKTEAWYIMDCDDDAEIIYGFKSDITKDEFRKSIEENTLTDFVNRVKVKKGDIFFIEAGTLHAICKGILLAEVQQNSNTTYRVYDYGRLQNGKPRELHIEKALDVTSTKALDASGKPMGETIQKDGYKETLLTKCDIFSMKRLDVEEKAEVIADEKSFVSLVALEGNGVVMHEDTCVTLYKGESLFIPASFGKVEILGNVTVLESRVE